MGDLYNSLQENSLDAAKVKEHLENIKAALSDNAELSSVIAAAAEEFNTFFKNYGKPYFVANKFHRHHTPVSANYNETIHTADKDIGRLYSLVNSSMKLTTKAFNYSQIINKQLLNTATIAASKVIDLSIFAGFLKGKVIVAGDDFYNEELIDKDAPISTDQAQSILGANALGLARSQTVFITHPNMAIAVEPTKPKGTESSSLGNVVATSLKSKESKGTKSVNDQPTPGNLERFYEGHFYTYMGELEAEGGTLNIQFIAAPDELPQTAVTQTINGVEVDENGDPITNAEGNNVSPDAASAATESAKGVGYYAVISASEEAKQTLRQKMVDGDPASYWQAEYVYAVPPLIDPYAQIGQDPSDDDLLSAQTEEVPNG
jgi:hypothetical protein